MNDYKREEIKQYILDNYQEYEIKDITDLHNQLFNTDYYIYGTYNAKQWCGDEVFNIIETIQEYEEEHFDEIYTDFSNPERVVNMYCYIVGEELLHEMAEELKLEV